MTLKVIQYGIITILLSLIMGGCGAKPEPKVEPKKVVHTPDPADLYLASQAVMTSVNNTITKEHYDLTVKVNNTNKTSSMIKLENKGDLPLKIEKISFKNETKLFKLGSQCGDSIPGNSYCELKVMFFGDNRGRYTSDITVFSNSNGKYIGPIAKIHVIANAKDRVTGIINPIEYKKVEKKQKPMTKLMFNSAGEIKYATIKNNGLEDLKLNGFSIMGDKKSFSFSHACPDILKVNQKCEIAFTYKANKPGLNLAYLIVDSNGVIAPSDIIRLKGLFTKMTAVNNHSPEILQLAFNDSMDIVVNDASVSNNQNLFLEDTDKTNTLYYFRTMYQNFIDPQFKEYFEEMVAYYFKKNSYSVTRNAHSANKIVNIYPHIKMLKNKKNDLQVVANIDLGIVTKSASQKEDENITYSMTLQASNYSDDYFVYAASADLMVSFMFNLLGLDD